MTDTTEVEATTTRSPLAQVLSDERVLDAASRLIEGERRLKRSYTVRRSHANSQDIAQEMFFARRQIQEAREDLSERAQKAAVRIVQAEPVIDEVTA